MYKIGNSNQTLKQTQVKSNNQKDGMPPINLSRQSSKSSQSSQSGKKTYDQNKNTQGQQQQQGSANSSRSVSKQSSLGGSETNYKLTEDKFKNLIIENNNLSTIIEQKDQELDDLKASYKSQYQEIMTKVDQMEQFIHQQDKRNQDMMEEQVQKNEIIEQLQTKITAQEQIIEQERIKCLGYQANFTQIETHISQVISENENLNILKDQKESEIMKKQEELQNALSKIEELELQLNIFKENNPQVFLESSELIKIQEYQISEESLKTKIASLEEQIDQFVSQESEYQHKIQILQEQLEQLQFSTANIQNINNSRQLFESQSTYEQTPINIQIHQQQDIQQQSESKQQQEEITEKPQTTSNSAKSSVYQSSNYFEQEISKFKEQLNLKLIIIQQLNEENAQLKQEIQQIQMSIASKQEALQLQDQDEVLHLKTQINDLQNQISLLESKQIEQSENFTVILNEKIKAEQNINNLNLQLECLKNELENSNSLAKSKKQLNEKTSSRLEEFRAQLRQLSQENTELAQKNNQLQNDVESLKSQLQITNISLDASQKLAIVRGEELTLFEEKFKQNVQQIEQYKSQYCSALENLLKFQNNLQQN